MIRILVAAALLAIALSGSTADAALVGCFGAPPEYIAAFDTVRGQSKNGQVDYPEQRWYDEQQNWSTPPGVHPGHHSQHVHTGRCIPNGSTWTATTRWMDVEYVFHNTEDYRIAAAATSQVAPAGANSADSRLLYSASPAQLADLQAASDASTDVVSQAFQSYLLDQPTYNGYKEVRGGVVLEPDGPTALWVDWHLDARWYYTDNVAGLPAGPVTTSGQIAVRNRALVTFHKPASVGGALTDDYHHSGWCGMNPPQPVSAFQAVMGQGSAAWTRAKVATAWSRTLDKQVCFYISDGGGEVFVELDPNHHVHDPSQPDGENHGVWYWQPANSRHEVFSNHTTGIILTTMTVPASVIATLPAGLHKLVLTSTDQAECFRVGNPCPPDVRASWTTVSVLPFRVQ